MRGGEAFEEVLDQHIQGLEADRRVTFTPSRCSTATAYGFFFLPSPLRGYGPPLRLRGYGATGLRTPAPSHLRTPAPSHLRTPAPSRVLSGDERHALGELIALGAALHDGFTLRELRSAFRALARRYHPDRHANSSGDEKARLAEIFSRVCDSYQVLARI